MRICIFVCVCVCLLKLLHLGEIFFNPLRNFSSFLSLDYLS